MSKNLRDWQKEAKNKCLQWFTESKDNRFVLNCAPGTGKTICAISIADELFNKNMIERVVVIAPQDTVVDDWADKYLEFTGRGMQRSTKLDGDHGEDICCTWQVVSSLLDGFQKVCNEKKTLLIADEIHHAAITAVWGRSVESGFSNASFILALTGTPIRTNSENPAFLEVKDGQLTHPKNGQYILTYGKAIELGYCRPIVFHRHEANFDVLDEEGGPKLGEVSGSTSSASDNVKGTQVEKMIHESTRFYSCCTALRPNPDGSPDMDGYQASMIEEGIQKLEERRLRLPQAGGLVIAPQIEHANYMAEIIKLKTGKKPLIVNTEEGSAESKARIKRFRRNLDDDWLVSVDMVGEGVDIQRLRVLVYLPRGRTDLRFRQAMGRIVRKYEGVENDDSSAYVVMPAMELFDKLARNVENEMPAKKINPKKTKKCPSCETENKKDAKKCISESCDHKFPEGTPRYKKCKDEKCLAINPIGAKSCSECGKDFGTPFIVTLKDVFRQNIITRGQDISEDDTRAAEKLSTSWFDFVDKSTNPTIRRLARENPPEALVSLSEQLQEFIKGEKKKN